EPHEQLRRRLGGGHLSAAVFHRRRREDAEGAGASARHHSALHQVGSAGGGTVIALTRREFHLFQAAGRDFLYLVPSAAVFALDQPTAAVLNVVTSTRVPAERVVETLAGRFDAETVTAAIGELVDVRAIGYEQQPEERTPRL